MDASGMGILVTMDCGLVGDTTEGIWRACKYQCIEDTSVPRHTTIRGGTDDFELPKPITLSPSRSILRCKSCPKTERIEKNFTSYTPPGKDCSKKECKDNFREIAKKWKISCRGAIAPPAVKACKVAAAAWLQAVLPTCNVCERD